MTICTNLNIFGSTDKKNVYICVTMQNEPKEKRGRIAAVGTFDGVHLGHKSVLNLLKSQGLQRQLEPVAFTFRRHPLCLINPANEPPELTPLWKKKKLLDEAGVSPIVLDFDEALRATSALQWMERLVNEFGVKVLVVGYDHTFGSDGINMSVEDYRNLGRSIGLEVILGDEIEGVSSSAIRKAVKDGDMPAARKMLGRPFSITSKVTEGNKLGHSLGFPTANIMPPAGGALPKPGVYAAIVKTLSDGRKFPAMVNIGTRPTVMRGNDTVLEAHLIGFSGDLYGKEITVRFLKRLRDEKKFDSIEALKNQLAADKIETEDLIKSESGLK
ncbi:MAG: riboflavin biosynthesis protein RibF [Muribaculaceae bacterium]|nr:riboflavin biosynthesis protein RibF [Muribaculaceae bacterium]